MNVNINFTINVDADEWCNRNRAPFVAVDQNDPDVVHEVSVTVRAHAENVIRDLFADMGWTIQECE